MRFTATTCTLSSLGATIVRTCAVDAAQVAAWAMFGMSFGAASRLGSISATRPKAAMIGDHRCASRPGNRDSQASASSAVTMVRLPTLRARSRPAFNSWYALVRPMPYRRQNSSTEKPRRASCVEVRFFCVSIVDPLKWRVRQGGQHVARDGRDSSRRSKTAVECLHRSLRA